MRKRKKGKTLKLAKPKSINKTLIFTSRNIETRKKFERDKSSYTTDGKCESYLQIQLESLNSDKTGLSRTTLYHGF